MFKDERLDTSLLMFFYYAIELSYPYNLSVDLKIVKAGEIAPPFLFLYRWRTGLPTNVGEGKAFSK